MRCHLRTDWFEIRCLQSVRLLSLYLLLFYMLIPPGKEWKANGEIGSPWRQLRSIGKPEEALPLTTIDERMFVVKDNIHRQMFSSKPYAFNTLCMYDQLTEAKAFSKSIETSSPGRSWFLLLLLLFLNSISYHREDVDCPQCTFQQQTLIFTYKIR